MKYMLMIYNNPAGWEAEGLLDLIVGLEAGVTSASRA
jgi:hypothetical protein